MLALLEALVCSAVAAYLSWTLIRLRHRNAESWGSLLGRLRIDWTARELSDLCRLYPEKHIGLAEKWHRVREARGLWAMFTNAGVLLEIADYAARNNSHIAPWLLRELRNNAVQIRVCVLKTMAAYAAGSFG